MQLWAISNIWFPPQGWKMEKLWEQHTQPSSSLGFLARAFFAKAISYNQRLIEQTQKDPTQTGLH